MTFADKSNSSPVPWSDFISPHPLLPHYLSGMPRILNRSPAKAQPMLNGMLNGGAISAWVGGANSAWITPRQRGMKNA